MCHQETLSAVRRNEAGKGGQHLAVRVREGHSAPLGPSDQGWLAATARELRVGSGKEHSRQKEQGDKTSWSGVTDSKDASVATAGEDQGWVGRWSPEVGDA